MLCILCLVVVPLSTQNTLEKADWNARQVFARYTHIFNDRVAGNDTPYRRRYFHVEPVRFDVKLKPL